MQPLETPINELVMQHFGIIRGLAYERIRGMRPMSKYHYATRRLRNKLAHQMLLPVKPTPRLILT